MRYQEGPVRALFSGSTGGDVESSPAVVNGVVYIGSDDGYVYALSGSPTSSPLPTPTSTPTVPEFPVLIILPLFASLLLIAVALTYRKKINLKKQTAYQCSKMEQTVSNLFQQ
jgi:PQQ-like domain